MDSPERRILLAALLGLAAGVPACGGGGGGDDVPSAAPPPADDQVVASTVRSTRTGGSYAIQTFLPASYASGTTLLPVIYATEGDAPYGPSGQSRFEAFKAVLQRRGTQAILVGIGGTAQRGTDFLLPGAALYLDFLTKDLAPTIERQYRADPKRRMLSGLSHGGYFVVAALVLEAAAGSLSFSHYLSTESSYGADGNATAYVAWVRQQLQGKSAPATLFLAGASAFNGSNVIAPLYAQLATQTPPGLVLVRSLYETSHVGADLLAFEEALTRFVP